MITSDLRKVLKGISKVQHWDSSNYYSKGIKSCTLISGTKINFL